MHEVYGGLGLPVGCMGGLWNVEVVPDVQPHPAHVGEEESGAWAGAGARGRGLGAQRILPAAGHRCVVFRVG